MSIRNNRSVEVNVAQVNRYEGHALMVPQIMDLRQAGESLIRAAEEEERQFTFHASVNTAPFDGAWAFNKALAEQYGIAMQKAVWGERPVVEIPIDAHGHFIAVPWGQFEVPGVPGVFETNRTRDDNGRMVFQASASLPGKYKDSFDEVMERTRRYVAEESIYKGKALDLRLGDLGSGLAKIKFLDVVNARRPIYSEVLADVFEHDVLPYITEPALIQQLRGNAKLGVLFAGQYGTGKSMGAMYMARLCEQNGRTFAYGRPNEIAQIIDFVQMYLPALVLIEDLESVVGGDERTDALNLILNKLDGVDTKNGDLIFVATTNHPEKINQAMMRPGRIDVIMDVTAPDAAAAVEIAKSYARGRVKDGEDFTQAGLELAGLIPAVIEQAVARAQVRGELKYGNPELTNDTLLAAARAVQRDRARFQHAPERTPMEVMGDALGSGIGRGMGEALAQVSVVHQGNGRAVLVD